MQPEYEERPFTIGDNKSESSRGQYVEAAMNRALVKGNRYQVTLVAVNQWGNDYNVSAAKLDKYWRPGYGSEEITATNTGNVVGWVILVLLLISIPVVLFYILKRYVAVHIILPCISDVQPTQATQALHGQCLVRSQEKKLLNNFHF